MLVLALSASRRNWMLTISESDLDLAKTFALSLQFAVPAVRVVPSHSRAGKSLLKAARAEQLPAWKQIYSKVSAPEQSCLFLPSSLCCRGTNQTPARTGASRTPLLCRISCEHTSFCPPGLSAWWGRLGPSQGECGEGRVGNAAPGNARCCSEHAVSESRQALC